jgi:hypothetical protein
VTWGGADSQTRGRIERNAHARTQGLQTLSARVQRLTFHGIAISGVLRATNGCNCRAVQQV